MRHRVVTAHISYELARRLDSLAERLERPRGWVVKEALAGYLAIDEERHRQTLAALAEAESEQLVEHAEVRAWVLRRERPRRKAGGRTG
jgi:predicted transcriptional regulator